MIKLNTVLRIQFFFKLSIKFVEKQQKFLSLLLVREGNYCKSVNMPHDGINKKIFQSSFHWLKTRLNFVGCKNSL